MYFASAYARPRFPPAGEDGPADGAAWMLPWLDDALGKLAGAFDVIDEEVHVDDGAEFADKDVVVVNDVSDELGVTYMV